MSCGGESVELFLVHTKNHISTTSTHVVRTYADFIPFRMLLICKVFKGQRPSHWTLYKSFWGGPFGKAPLSSTFSAALWRSQCSWVLSAGIFGSSHADIWDVSRGNWKEGLSYQVLKNYLGLPCAGPQSCSTLWLTREWPLVTLWVPSAYRETLFPLCPFVFLFEARSCSVVHTGWFGTHKVAMASF